MALEKHTLDALALRNLPWRKNDVLDGRLCAADAARTGEAKHTTGAVAMYSTTGLGAALRSGRKNNRLRCVLDESGVTELGKQRHVEEPVEIHVDTCHGHHDCPITDGNWELRVLRDVHHVLRY